MLSCSIWFSAPSFWKARGLDSRCVGRVYGADGAVRLALGKDSVSVTHEAGWASVPVWAGAENLASTRIRSPDRPAGSQLLYRLSYPTHFYKWMSLKIKQNLEHYRNDTRREGPKYSDVNRSLCHILQHKPHTGSVLIAEGFFGERPESNNLRYSCKVSFNFNRSRPEFNA